MAFVLSFGAIGVGTASAAPRCCDPICLQEEPPNACNWCTPCAGDETTAVSEMVYDEVLGLCYESDAAEPSPCDVVETGDGAQDLEAK
ncbi:hypothetical protein OV203_34215 [Nannocystis sp. ILAH1]|uniref:hypothetical protein n=1 Tax=Nannocystis sp. ILAH1 TaxID=2996789 RepID=UPI00226FAC6D|nr:hypothetical protein [Nannocystis sp. ILAH1]MCY0992243.1 hypothetical protein [Nannocystis sp. ILAH1]